MRRSSVSHGTGWSDPELGLADEKVHRRPISRLLPDFVPESVLSGVDSVDEVYTGFVQLMEKSPSLRVLVCVYLVCLHVGFLILFFRRKLCVCYLILFGCVSCLCGELFWRCVSCGELFWGVCRVRSCFGGVRAFVGSLMRHCEESCKLVISLGGVLCV